MDRKENPFDQFDQEPANQFDQFEVTQSANPFDQFDQMDKVAAPVARGPIKGPAQRTVVPPAAAPVAPVTAEDYLEPATSAPPPLSEAVRSQLDRKYDALSPQDRDAIIRGRTKDGRQTLEGMYFAYRDKQFAARDADTAAFAKQLGPMAYRLSDLTDPRKESRARMAREQGASDKTAENIAAQAAIEGLPAEEVVPQAKESKFDFDLAARYKDLNPVVRGAVKGYYGYKQSVLGLNQALGDLVGATDFADTQRAGAETAGGRVESIGERPDYLSRNFEGAVSSVVQNIPGILGGIATGGALVPLSVLGVQSFGQNYTEGVSRGLTRDLAAQRAGVFAAAEILGERFGLAGLTNGIRKAFGKKSFEEASDAVSRYIVSQIPGEQLTTATQFLADKYPSFALNPQAGIKEYLQQAGDTLTQTIMQGGLMMGGVKGAQFLATGRFGAEPGEQPPIAGRPPEEPPMAPTEEPPIAPSGAPGGERIEPTVTAEPTITPERVEPAFGAEPTIEPAVEPEEPGVPGMVTTEMLAPEAVEQPEGQVAPAEPPVPSPIKPAVAPPQEPSNETTVDGMLPVNVPLKDLTLSKDVPQFKMGADAKGVVEPLGGKFERTGVAPIQVWRRLDGSLEVISGRHRLDLARRSGEKTIPAQIHDESQGFTPTMAAILDAELNIRDGQGKVKDYVNYFKAAGITPEDAESRGLLARSTGKRAYTIATTGSDELVAAVRNDQIGDEAAYYVALNAPNDPRLQSVGLQAIQDGKSANLAVNTMLAMKALGMEQDTTTDMFGFDDSAMKEAAAMAQVANKKQREIQTRLAAITGAAKNPAVAKAEGIDIRDPEAVNRRIGELRQMKNAWDNWATSPELIGEIRQARGVEAPGLTLRGETEEEIRAREEAAAAEEQRLRSEAEAARRAEQAEIERKRAEETTDLFQLGQTAEQQMSGMGDLFAEPAAPAKAPREAPEFPFEEGARVRFLPTDTSPLGGGVAEGQIIGLDKTSGKNYRVRLRLDKDAPQGSGKMERVVYSNAGTFEAAEAPAAAPAAKPVIERTTQPDGGVRTVVTRDGKVIKDVTRWKYEAIVADEPQGFVVEQDNITGKKEAFLAVDGRVIGSGLGATKLFEQGMSNEDAIRRLMPDVESLTLKGKAEAPAAAPEAADMEQLNRLMGELQKARSEQEFTDAAVALGESVPKQPFLGVQLKELSSGVRFNIARSSDGNRIVFNAGYDDPDGFEIARKPNQAWKLTKTPRFAKQIIERNQAAPVVEKPEAKPALQKPAAEKAEPRADFDKRAKNAIDSFVDSIVEQFDMTPETALAAFNWLRSEKLAEVDPVLGKVNLKDGRFWDGEILRRAALETEARGREPGATDEDVKAVGEVFEGARAGQEEELHRLFDKPKEVVRLTQKGDFLTPAEAKKRIAEWKKNAEAQGKTNANSDKVVLSLFDLTGAWSEPWLEAGYQVYRFDIQDQWTMTDERTGEELNLGDINNFSVEYFEDLFGNFEGNDVHAILAACPCTDFASSGARHFKAKDASGQTMDSVQLVQQTLATIEYFRPAIWAIENPVGRIEKLTGLPPWSLSFDPYMFGDPYTKKTLLWGRFNANLPTAPVDPVEGSKMHRMYGGKSLATKNARSVTPEGFAYAFFQANNAIDHPVMALANIYDRLNPKLFERAMKLGVSEQDIRYAIDDAYYSELDDAAAEAELVRLANEAQAAKAPKPKAEKPAEKPIAAKPAEKLPYTKEQREDAEIHAKEVGGEIVWQRGEYALIRGYSDRTGDPMYAPTIGSSRARVDISAFIGKQIPDDVKKEMLETKERLEKEAAEAHAANPFIKFKDGIALSEDIPADLAGVIREWKNLLNINVPVYVSTIEDAKRNIDNFTGPHRRIGSGTLDENEAGSMRRMTDDSYYILFKKSTSYTKMLETLAHEIGHLHMTIHYKRASQEDKKALEAAHIKWMESQKDKSAKEWVDAMRARSTGRMVKEVPGMKASEMDFYWRKFGEWYADQTARWAMSAEAPVSVVEKFFKRLGNQLRRFYQSLRGQKYLPDETFREFIERAISPTYMGPTDTTLPPSDEAERQLRDAERESATWSPKRIKMLVREFVYRQEGRENDTKAYAAFINPTEFVRATTEPGEFRKELLRAEEGLDMDRLREEDQTPFLKVDYVPGDRVMWSIVNHEGRHRMAALAAAGVERVPVLIRMTGEAQAWPAIESQWLSGQRFGTGIREKGDAVEITDLTPISWANRDDLQQKFGGEGIAFSIEQPEAKPTKRMSDEDIRDEQIREYSALRQRLAAVPRRIATGKSALPDGPAKGMTELERVYLKSLVDRAQYLKAAIKISAPRLDSPEQFLARALKEHDAGNISKEVLDVIQAAYKQQPRLLNGLKLSIKQAPEGEGRFAGAFLNMSRIVRLYKGSSGVDDPKTIRHELTHSLEQMMTPEQRGVIIDKWQDDLARAIRKHKDAAHQKYFEALLKFLDKPTMENYKAAIAALPSYDMYQFITPSEYWAVNAENLMASQLGGPWQRFKAAMKRMFEALKDVFGFDNKYVVQRVFKDIMTGSKERVTTEMLADRAGIAVYPAQNIEEDKTLIEKYKRPKTPMLDKKPLATFLLDQFKNGKDLFKDFVENPKEAAADAGNSLIDGALRARMATVWYGAGLESRDFAKYGGQLRTSEDLATASVALDNAIRSGNIGVEVIFRGGLKFDKDKLQLVAVETKKGMRGVYDAERRLKDKLGNQLGTDIIQGYLEAKRSISIMNEFYDRQAAYEGAKENLKMLREQGASEKKIKEAVALMESAERSLESVKKAVSSVTMTEEEMYDFAARDKVHPELREIMDNWTAVNQNLLRIWRDVGLLSPERYEALASIPDYVPWYRIMQDEEDPHTPLMSTTRGLTNIGREKLFKRTKPTDVLDFKGKEGKKVLDESGNLIGMSFKVPPSTVLRVEVDGEKIKAQDLSVTDDGRVMVKAPIDDASLVVFKVTRPIQNIVDNMTQNVMRMTMNAIRQYAAGRIVSEYATRDPQGRVMTFPKEDLAKGRFSFVINGQRKVVEISDPLPLGAIYGMDSLNLKMFALPAAFANFFRRTITLSFVFQLKQVFKDAPTAAAVTGVRNPAALILGTYKGLITALLQPVGKKVGIDIEPAVDILKAAGIGGFQNPSRTPEAEVKRRLGIMNRNVFDFVIKALDHIGDSADMAQRIAVYKRVMAETGNETQALYQAANVINFLHHGSSGTAQALVKTVPFMGAYANAMDVLVNSLIGGGLKGMSRRKAIARLSVTTGMLIGITLLYTMLVSGDDDYEELDDQTKLRNFIIPGTDIMLPMNTSYAFFWKAITEMLYNEAIKKATPNEIDQTRLKKALSTAARDMLLGPEPVPQIIKGPAEIAIGYNFFTGRDIIPEGLKNVETFQQYTAATSELGKWFSSYTEVPGTDGKRILSPIEADHLIRSTFGTAGALGQWVTNRIAVEAGTRPELTEKEAPITGAFLRPEVDRGREDLFYDLRNRVNQKYNTLRELERDDEKKAEAYDEKYEDLLDMHKDVNKIAADLSDINAEIRELSTSKDIKMTPAERRAEIRALQQEKKEVLDDIYELRKEAGL